MRYRTMSTLKLSAPVTRTTFNCTSLQFPIEDRNGNIVTADRRRAQPGFETEGVDVTQLKISLAKIPLAEFQECFEKHSG